MPIHRNDQCPKYMTALNRLELLAVSGHHSIGVGGTFPFKGKGWKKNKASFKGLLPGVILVNK